LKVSEGKHNINNTSSETAGSKNSTRNANFNANIVIIGHRYSLLFYCRKCRDIFPWFTYVGNAYEWWTL